MTSQTEKPHSSHWGAFFTQWDGQNLRVRPHPGDPNPSPLLGNFVDALRHRARIAKPLVSSAWLDHGPGSRERRIDTRFVEYEWDAVLDLLAVELTRVTTTYGAKGIFGGSYGWASAGRFHHAQSQIHRFLNTAFGGYVRSVNSYSVGASTVILPHVAAPIEKVLRQNVTWEQVVEHTDMVLAFGGMPIKNMMVSSGGVSRHTELGAIWDAARRGCVFNLVSPLRDDLPPEASAQWHPIVPGTDVAMMLGLAHTLIVEGLCNRAFLDRYCVGFGEIESYILGTDDNCAKNAEWAAEICQISAATIRQLARQLVAGRSIITVAHALQRAQFGEQPVWMGLVLAAMVGQIGLPGGGYHYGLGAMGQTGRRALTVPVPTFPQGKNTVEEFIPVARISDMLLNPGKEFEFNGGRFTFPDIKLVYWAGGNPFHHHQDIGRLTRAFSVPETIVIHESAWTATARFADIVLPATMSLERDDIGASSVDPLVVAMKQAAPPFGEARDDYEIFAALSKRLGVVEAFTEGRTSHQWLAHIYDQTRQPLAATGSDAPSFDEFWALGELHLPVESDRAGGIFEAFRNAPIDHPLPTPSGKIEIYSETIASFGYDDCPGHPVWLASTEPTSPDFPLILVANQPATRLHSQLDFGGYSQSKKIAGREVVRLHPADAQARGIADRDIVILHNHRGACLAAACISEEVRQGVVHLPTGAWFDPDPESAQLLCLHGNPNVLTRDIGTSRLAQGSCGQLAVVQCAKHAGAAGPIRAYEPPIPTSGDRASRSSSA